MKKTNKTSHSQKQKKGKSAPIGQRRALHKHAKQLLQKMQTLAKKIADEHRGGNLTQEVIRMRYEH